MAKSTWYRAIIRKSTQFMSYVKGWVLAHQGQVAPAPPFGGFPVPQNSGKIGQYGTYDFPVSWGSNNTPTLYRQTLDLEYEYIPGYGQTSSQIIVERRKSSAVDFGKNLGIAIRGGYFIRNQATEDFLLKDPSGSLGTYWRRPTSTSSDVLQDTLENTDITKINLSPFGVLGNAETCYNTVIKQRGPYFPLIYPNEYSWGTAISDFQGATMNISFFAWKGWVSGYNEDSGNEQTECPIEQPLLSQFQSPVIGLRIQNQKSRGNNDKSLWIKESQTYIRINYLDKTYDWQNEDQALGVPAKANQCWSIKSVQFEDAPNDFVKIMISAYVNQYEHSTDINWEYPNLSILFGNKFCDTAEWWKRAYEDGHYVKINYTQSGYLCLFGFNFNFKKLQNVINVYKSLTNNELVPNYRERQLAQYQSYFNNYIKNTSSTGVGYGQANLRIVNPDWQQMSMPNRTGAKCLYLHFYFGNSSYGANNEYFGGYATTTQPNFMSNGANTPPIIGFESCMNMGWDIRMDVRYKVFLFDTSPPTFPDNPLPNSTNNNPILIPPEYYVNLNHGHNKIVMVTPNNGENKYIYINGKKYIHDRNDLIPLVNPYYYLYGKSQDYLLEYGWWNESLTSEEAIKLCQI